MKRLLTTFIIMVLSGCTGIEKSDNQESESLPYKVMKDKIEVGTNTGSAIQTGFDPN